MKLWLPFLFFALAHVAQAQMVYSGHISDVGTGEELVGVKVRLKGQVPKASSNIFGDFALKALAGNDSTNIHIFNNVLVWEGNQVFNLQLYNSNGKLVKTQNSTAAGGTYILPRLSSGIYILKIEAKNESQNLKLYSNGEHTVVVDVTVNHLDYHENGKFDTLIFSKAGYFDRTVGVPRKSSFLEVKMLNGSYDDLKYFTELIDPIAFDIISSTPPRTNFGEVKSVKLMYDKEKDILYYMNTKRYALHYDFAIDALDYRGNGWDFNNTQYVQNPRRYLYPGSLNYFESQDRYVLQFIAANELNCNDIQTIYKKIEETSYIGKKLHFYSIKPEWDNCSGIRHINSETLYAGQNYQALNLTENYGYLRKVEVDKIEEEYLSRHDMVLTNGIPNDLSVVAGIITTEFQTPLSHINVLSNSRNTPNMALRNGWESKILDSLIGKLVYLNVGPDSFQIRSAKLDEAQKFWADREPKRIITLKKNTDFKELIDMEKASIADIDKIGGKAANFAEIMNVQEHGAPIPVPEMAFAIPFHYYQAHIEQNGLDVFIDSMLNNNEFKSNPAYRKQQLNLLSDSIINTPIDPVLVVEVLKKINYFKNFESFRFRSSTNAEDLEGFSGAGLYDSKSAKKNHPTKTIEAAIKKVWASLWAWRAFEERDYFKIDHRSCAMGILVHRSFPDEDANGVLLTKNLYNGNPGFIINVQYKEYSIVFPEPGVLHDQIMVIAWAIDQNSEYTIEYLSFSNIKELHGKHVMTDEEIKELAVYAMAIKKRFYYDLRHNCDCTFDDFGVDIEFKVDSTVSPRKVYVKQARLYK